MNWSNKIGFEIWMNLDKLYNYVLKKSATSLLHCTTCSNEASNTAWWLYCFFFTFQAVCFILSLACIFICLIAATFPGIHAMRISTYHSCTVSSNQCKCFQSAEPEARIFLYQSMNDCNVLLHDIWMYLVILSVLNGVASTVSFWFVVLLWRSKYGKFYSGLKFHSYSANVPAHP